MANRPIIKLDGKFSVGLPKIEPGDVFRILPFKRSYPVSIVLGVFLIGFSAPLFSVGEMMGMGPTDDLFTLVTTLFTVMWMMGWSVGVAVLALLFVGSLLGRESLHMKPGELTIRIELLGVGLARTFTGAKINGLCRVEPEAGAQAAWRGSHLMFEYAGEEIDFGSNIDARRAELLSEEIVNTAINQAPRTTIELAIPAQQATPKSLPSNDLGLSSASVVALVVANIVPILGVLFLGWSVGEIMLLYWAESAVIGIYSIGKMWVIGRWGILLFGPFFFGHYGGFMVFHLLFIYGFMIQGPESNRIPLADVLSDFVALSPALLALLISHGVSFVQNFLGRREYEGKKLGQQMVEPYRRIIIMHVTIIFGGFLTMFLSNAVPALLLMIVLKVGADLVAHLRQHRDVTDS